MFVRFFVQGVDQSVFVNFLYRPSVAVNRSTHGKALRMPLHAGLNYLQNRTVVCCQPRDSNPADKSPCHTWSKAARILELQSTYRFKSDWRNRYDLCYGSFANRPRATHTFSKAAASRPAVTESTGPVARRGILRAHSCTRTRACSRKTGQR